MLPRYLIAKCGAGVESLCRFTPHTHFATGTEKAEPANVLKIDHVLCDHHERVIRRAGPVIPSETNAPAMRVLRATACYSMHDCGYPSNAAFIPLRPGRRSILKSVGSKRTREAESRIEEGSGGVS
jgi:hypothetical protein